MANNNQLRGTPFYVTASGTTSVSASYSKTTNAVYITDLTGTSTTAGTWALLGGATGTTVFWQGTGNFSEDFIEPLGITTAGTITLLFNGATNTFANMSGYTI